MGRATEHLIAHIKKHPIPFAIGGMGLIASLILLLCSTGTNDIRSWESFARQIQTDGLFALYEKDKLFNHPPLMGILSWLSLEVSSILGLSFAITFKLFPVLANIGAALALRSIYEQRVDSRKGAHAFALFSWALCPMFVAAYHGNTDCICVFFCLWSLYFLEVRKKPFLGGLMLAAAINVKIVPLLVALPMLAGFRSFKDARGFILGSMTAAIPFVIALLGVGTTFVKNVFGYGSSLEPWGMQLALVTFRSIPGMTTESGLAINNWYFENGKYVLIAAVVLLAAYGFWRKLSHARLLAASLSLFLLLTPGFGVQYTAYPAPLIFAVSLAWGTRFSMVAGLYIGLVYASWSHGVFPLESSYKGYPPNLAFLGFAVWLVLLSFLPSCLRRTTERESGQLPPADEPPKE